MNPWWLMLIVPAAVYFGFAICALLVAGAREDAERERLTREGKGK
jgi:hypothetical protein